MKRFAVGLTALMLVGSVNAENWVKAAENTKGTLKDFVDLDTVKKANINVLLGNDNYISAVVQPTYLKGNENRKKGIYYTKELWYISCEDSSVFKNASINYNVKDEVINTYQNQNLIRKEDFKYMFPDTMGYGVLQAVCNSPQASQIQYSNETTGNTLSYPLAIKSSVISDRSSLISAEEMKKKEAKNKAVKLCHIKYKDWEDFKHCTASIE